MSIARRLLIAALFLLAVVAGLQVMDAMLYRRAKRLYDRAASAAGAGAGEADLHVTRRGGELVVAASGVQADVCNALTGRMWFSFLMPRSAGLAGLHPGVRSRTDSCERASPNTLLFSFPVAAG